MKKKPAKKKNPLVNILVALAFIILAIMILFKEDSQINKVGMGLNKPETKPEKDIPSQLKWFDKFKGIDNMKTGKYDEKPANFMEYEKRKNSN